MTLKAKYFLALTMLVLIPVAMSEATFVTGDELLDLMTDETNIFLVVYEPGCYYCPRIFDMMYNLGRFYDEIGVNMQFRLIDSIKYEPQVRSLHVSRPPVGILFRDGAKLHQVMYFKDWKESAIAQFINDEMYWDHEFYFVGSNVHPVNSTQLLERVDATVTSLTPKLLVILFHVSWCNFCELVRSRMREVAKHFESVPNLVEFVEIDGMKYKEMKRPFDVEKFPTISMVRSDNTKFTYKGRKRIQTIVEYISFLTGFVPDANFVNPTLQSPDGNARYGVDDVLSEKIHEMEGFAPQQLDELQALVNERKSEVDMESISAYNEAIDILRAHGVSKLREAYLKYMELADEMDDNISSVIRANVMRTFLIHR